MKQVLFDRAGNVHVTRGSGTSQRVVAKLSPGDFFGERFSPGR